MARKKKVGRKVQIFTYIFERSRRRFKEMKSIRSFKSFGGMVRLVYGLAGTVNSLARLGGAKKVKKRLFLHFFCPQNKNGKKSQTPIGSVLLIGDMPIAIQKCDKIKKKNFRLLKKFFFKVHFSGQKTPQKRALFWTLVEAI